MNKLPLIKPFINTNVFDDLYFYFGISLWGFGFLFEVLADEQKRKFRTNKNNKNRFISTGLWSISRHPNYFGEILLWVGMAIIALPTLKGWQHVTLISPIFIYFLLTDFFIFGFCSFVEILGLLKSDMIFSASIVLKFFSTNLIFVLMKSMIFSSYNPLFKL